MKRDLKAVVLAHLMDKNRKDLFVEGQRDRLFLTHLKNGEITSTRILEVDSVDIPGVKGGNRDRLLYLGKRAYECGIGSQLLAFADSDMSHFFPEVRTKNVTVTDFRDLEGYLINEKCIRTYLLNILFEDKVSSKDILFAVRKSTLRVGCLRILDFQNKYKLPFKKTNLTTCLTFENNEIILDVAKFIRMLLSNSKRSSKLSERIVNELREIDTKYVEVDFLQLAHGKDTLTLIEFAMRKLCRKPVQEVSSTLWLTFNPSDKDKFKRLSHVMQFILDN